MPSRIPIPKPRDEPRTTADEWAEEANRQAHELRRSVERAVCPDALGRGGVRNPQETPAAGGLFSEFRRKLASGEAVSRALARLAEALRFSGRITITFHQGKITKTVCEESYFGGPAAM